uniref:gamma-glutamylcyclotransferase n=1 Tax=Megaselia scalaris TaxID=36166 RepID=T1H017_MEGSC
MVLPEVIGTKFLYFGYGSNLLKKRLLMNNKSAVRKGFGKLENFTLGFNGFSKRWMGAPATIAPKEGAVVFGAVYEMDVSNIEHLDEQESVKEGVYIPISVPVHSASGEILMCRTYQLANIPEEWDGPSAKKDNKPSTTYLKTIVKGAVETKLPMEYVNFLKSFEHNGNMVDSFEKDLGLQNFTL